MTADHASCLLALLHWPRFSWHDCSWFYSDRNVFIAQLLFYSSIVIIHFIDLYSLFYADNTWFVFSFVKLSFHLSVPQFCVFYNVIVDFWRGTLCSIHVVYCTTCVRCAVYTTWYAVQCTRRGTLWQWRWHELNVLPRRAEHETLSCCISRTSSLTTRLDWTGQTRDYRHRQYSLATEHQQSTDDTHCTN